MKNLIKKWYFWVIIVVIVGIIGIGAGGNTSTTTHTETNASVIETAVTIPISDSINDLKCEIISATLGEVDYEGNPTVIITYNFTNNSKESASFYTSFNDAVYQNGIECEPNYGYDTETNEDKEIKPGTTLEITQSYVLNDTTTDIVVELTDWIGLNENVITKTFKITE